jgi:hypothetical protein
MSLPAVRRTQQAARTHSLSSSLAAIGSAQ